MIRSDRPSGAAESENGWRRPDPVPVEEPPEEELPRLGVQPVEPAPDDAHRDDARALVDHLRHAQPVAEELRQAGTPSRKTTRITIVAT